MVIRICISLRLSSVEHLFICLLTVCFSSLEKHTCSSSACFLTGLFFLMLGCMRCLYIFHINPLLVISFANIFSHLVGCLFAF